MTGTIFAIGGGEIKLRETLAIDKEIIKSSGKKHPQLLFIPTASSEAEAYVETVNQYFGEELGCKVDTLFLIDSPLTYEQIKDKIMGSDIIYVGGGNTRFLMKIWRESKVDLILMEALEKGIILSGLSAGSICWFDCGQSDSDFADGIPAVRYSCVEGLGIVPLLHAPHHNEDHRASDLIKFVNEQNRIALAISNNCAIEFNNGQYRIIQSSPGGYALKVYRQGDQIIEENLIVSETYKPMSELSGETYK